MSDDIVPNANASKEVDDIVHSYHSAQAVNTCLTDIAWTDDASLDKLFEPLDAVLIVIVVEHIHRVSLALLNAFSGVMRSHVVFSAQEWKSSWTNTVSAEPFNSQLSA